MKNPLYLLIAAAVLYWYYKQKDAVTAPGESTASSVTTTTPTQSASPITQTPSIKDSPANVNITFAPIVTGGQSQSTAQSIQNISSLPTPGTTAQNSGYSAISEALCKSRYNGTLVEPNTCVSGGGGSAKMPAGLIFSV